MMERNEVADAIIGLVTEYLDHNNKSNIEFGPVYCTPEEDFRNGSEYFRVDIVFDGDQEKLDGDLMLGMPLSIYDHLTKIEAPGVHLEDAMLCPYFHEKSEWNSYVKKYRPEWAEAR